MVEWYVASRPHVDSEPDCVYGRAVWPRRPAAHLGLPVAGFGHLNHWYLQDSPVAGVSPLTGLTNLTHLDLTGAKVSSAEVGRLRVALPQAVIAGPQVG